MPYSRPPICLGLVQLASTFKCPSQVYEILSVAHFKHSIILSCVQDTLPVTHFKYDIILCTAKRCLVHGRCMHWLTTLTTLVTSGCMIVKEIILSTKRWYILWSLIMKSVAFRLLTMILFNGSINRFSTFNFIVSSTSLIHTCIGDYNSSHRSRYFNSKKVLHHSTILDLKFSSEKSF